MNDLVLLSALLQGPAYGYSLKKTAGLIFGSKTMHSNVVYPLLKQFVRNGWVEQTSVPGERGQTRKQYRITAAGRRHLLERVAAFTEEDAANDGAFLFRVALFDALPKDRRQAIIEARRSFLSSRAIQLLKLREAAEPRSFGTVALERLRSVLAGELQWIRQLERSLGTKIGDSKCKPMPTRPATVHRS